RPPGVRNHGAIMANNITVYLSSTLKDLKPERDTVINALRQDCVVKESYNVSENNLLESCREDVEACDLYVCIVGARYGYVPTAEWNKEGRSITHLEFEWARETKKP